MFAQQSNYYQYFLFKCFSIFSFFLSYLFIYFLDDYYVINDTAGPSGPSGAELLLSSIPMHKKAEINFRGYAFARCVSYLPYLTSQDERLVLPVQLC